VTDQHKYGVFADTKGAPDRELRRFRERGIRVLDFKRVGREWQVKVMAPR
jgi:hypothetical protein